MELLELFSMLLFLRNSENETNFFLNQYANHRMSNKTKEP